MKYRLLALDIDGTLVDSNKQIQPPLKEAILSVQKKGVVLAIASGRPYPGVRSFVKELEMDRFGGYILSFNSGRIVECSTQKVISEQTFAPHYLKQLYRFAKENGANILSYDGDTVISECIDDPYLQLEARICGLTVQKTDSFPDYFQKPVPKSIITGEGELLAGLVGKLQEELGQELNIFRSEPFFLEVMPKGVDKASGLRILSDITNIPLSQMIACGDGYNDVTMIQAAGLGVAMENACDAAKQAADYITSTNDELGVLKVIEKFIL